MVIRLKQLKHIHDLFSHTLEIPALIIFLALIFQWKERIQRIKIIEVIFHTLFILNSSSNSVNHYYCVCRYQIISKTENMINFDFLNLSTCTIFKLLWTIHHLTTNPRNPLQTVDPPPPSSIYFFFNLDGQNAVAPYVT